MSKRFRFIALLLMLALLGSTVVVASGTTDSYLVEYENGYVQVECSVSSIYTGQPATVSLRSISNPNSFPLYFNDTIVGQNGEISLSFPYELDNVNAYFIRLNVAGSLVKDILFPEEEISYDENSLISQFVYYSNGEWNSLSSASYANLAGTTATIGVTVPTGYQGNAVIFAAKGSNGKLSSVAFGENYATDKYRASIAVPQNGTLEVYCWNSLTEMTPYCEKAVIPDDCIQTVVFTENTEVIAENPGKGWVRYRSDSQESQDVLQYVSIGYDRFNWNQVEPQEGVYDWSVIDTFINKWDALGKKAAFGIACASSTNSASYLTPKWVFDAGAAYTMNGSQYVPVWNDPVYLAKLEDFTRAFAQKYDGDPRIAYIDIRSYGNFGETHTSGLSGSVGLSANDEKAHIDIATRYFHQTQLIIPTANTAEQGIKTKYAVNKGVGLRIDSIMNGNYSETHKLDDAYGHEPTVFEFVNSYGSMKSAADAYGSASNDDGHWNKDRYLLSFFIGKPSYMDLGQYNNDSQNFINDYRELIELLSNKMGYHFVLESMNIPQYISAQKPFSVRATWINKGVAPLYEDCYPALALLDSNDQVIDKCWLTGFSPEEWMPDEEAIESANVQFAVAEGQNVKLAIGLFSKKTDVSPSFRIGNYNRTSNNWYVIANGAKTGDKYLMTPATQPSSTATTSELDTFYNTRIAPYYDVPTSTNLITDSTFEAAVSNWSPVRNLSKFVNQQASNPYAGLRVGRIYQRSAEWSGAQIDVTDLLKKNGAGTYRFEGYFRNDSGSTRNMTIFPLRINSVTEYSFTATGIGTSWKKVTGDVTITEDQINKMTHAVTLIIGDSRNSYNGNEIYMDNVTLTKIN